MADGNLFLKEEDAITASDLQAVQESCGFKFPPEFREHYLRHNGGEPQRYVFRSGEKVLAVHAFLPVKNGPEGGLFEDTYRRLKEERAVFPEHLVPFAVDPVGDYFCFSVRSGDEGAIYHFVGEYIPDYERAITKLSDSLESFLLSLEDDNSV